jgi:hypothetical protein
MTDPEDEDDDSPALSKPAIWIWLTSDPLARSKDTSFASTIWAGLSPPRESKMSDSSAADGPSAPLEDAGQSDLKSADWAREEISWDPV